MPSQQQDQEVTQALQSLASAQPEAAPAPKPAAAVDEDDEKKDDKEEDKKDDKSTDTETDDNNTSKKVTDQDACLEDLVKGGTWDPSKLPGKSKENDAATAPKPTPSGSKDDDKTESADATDTKGADLGSAARSLSDLAEGASDVATLTT